MTTNPSVLVTGGAGFIGSHLVPKLIASGCRVRILDNLSPQIHGQTALPPAWMARLGAEFQLGSVTNRDDWVAALRGIDQVVHLAAETGTGQSMYEVARYNEVNSQGTALLFDVLGNDSRRTVRRILLSSSRSVYGEGAYVDPARPDQRLFPTARTAAQLARQQWDPLSPQGVPLRAVATREADAVRPASIYAATKLAQEDLVRVGCESLGLGYILYRFQNVYGEGQSLKNPYTGILSIFSTRIRRQMELPIFEDGLESRDFIHVDDVAEAVRLGAQIDSTPDCVINVGSGQATTVLEMAEHLSRAFGEPSRAVVTGQYRLGDIRHNFACIETLRDRLGFAPRIALPDGLARFARWVQSEPLPDDLLEKANRELSERNLMGKAS